MCVLTILIGNLNIQRVNNDIKVNTMIKDASIMKETLLSMSFGNWMLYLKDSEIRSLEYIENYLHSSYAYMN